MSVEGNQLWAEKTLLLKNKIVKSYFAENHASYWKTYKIHNVLVLVRILKVLSSKMSLLKSGVIL